MIREFETPHPDSHDYLSERFINISETHDRNLRSIDSGLLKVPYSSMRYYDNSFTVTGAKMWNSLPLNIGHSPSLGSFKGMIKLQLIHKQCHGGCPYIYSAYAFLFANSYQNFITFI